MDGEPMLGFLQEGIEQRLRCSANPFLHLSQLQTMDSRILTLLQTSCQFIKPSELLEAEPELQFLLSADLSALEHLATLSHRLSLNDLLYLTQLWLRTHNILPAQIVERCHACRAGFKAGHFNRWLVRVYALWGMQPDQLALSSWSFATLWLQKCHACPGLKNADTLDDIAALYDDDQLVEDMLVVEQQLEQGGPLPLGEERLLRLQRAQRLSPQLLYRWGGSAAIEHWALQPESSALRWYGAQPLNKYQLRDAIEQIAGDTVGTARRQIWLIAGAALPASLFAALFGDGEEHDASAHQLKEPLFAWFTAHHSELAEGLLNGVDLTRSDVGSLWHSGYQGHRQALADFWNRQGASDKWFSPTALGGGLW
ncbi:hypothetical protein [Pokkaliibacter plantistimulans]|nr:hypothetical protein [Pokkaliibacter plantistimulans]